LSWNRESVLSSIKKLLTSLLEKEFENPKLETLKKKILKQINMALNSDKYMRNDLVNAVMKFQFKISIEDIKWRYLSEWMKEIMQELMRLTDFDVFSFYIQNWEHFTKKTITKEWEIIFDYKLQPNKKEHLNLYKIITWDYQTTTNGMKISAIPIEWVWEDFVVEASPWIYISGDKFTEAKSVENQIAIIDWIAFGIARIIKILETMDDLYKDELTKVYNRKYWERCDYKKWYLLALDIDHFKMVNDTYGHDIWDKVLKEIAEIIRKTLRIEDKIYTQRKEIDDWWIVHRTWGEEFVIYLDVENEEQAILVANRIRENVERHIITLDNLCLSFWKTVSIWIAEISESNKEKGEYKAYTLKKADKALYEAKETGRNKVVVHKD